MNIDLALENLIRNKSLECVSYYQFFNLFHAAPTSNNGGTIDRLLNDVSIVIDFIILAGVALGNIDQRSAMLPVTNGAATLVPLI
jgi:hypothetical protein